MAPLKNLALSSNSLIYVEFFGFKIIFSRFSQYFLSLYSSFTGLTTPFRNDFFPTEWKTLINRLSICTIEKFLSFRHSFHASEKLQNSRFASTKLFSIFLDQYPIFAARDNPDKRLPYP